MTDPIYVDLPDIEDGVEIIVRRTSERPVIVRRVGDFSLMMGETPPRLRIRDIETDPEVGSPTGARSAKLGLTILVSEGGRILGLNLHDDVTATWDRDSLLLDLAMFGHQARELRDKLTGLLAEIERPRSTD